MVTLANAWVAVGHAVTVAVASAEGPFRADLDARVEIVDLAVARVIAMWRPLRRLLRQRQPDAVLSTLTHTNIITAVAHRLAGSRARLVLREANLPPPPLRFADRGIALLAPLAYRRAHAMVAVSHAVADSLRRDRRVPDRIAVEVIDNPAVTADLDRRAAEAPPADLAGDGPPLLLAVGRLVPVKGFEVLIDAFARVVARRPARLVILGEGPLRETLEARVRDHAIDAAVSLPGFVANPFAVMRRAQVFVLSSRQEGSPNALVQAVALGCEAVATRIEGVTDRILESGRIGRLVAVDDAGALAAAIEAALDEPLSPDRPAFRRRFDSARIVDRYASSLALPTLRNDPSDSAAYRA